MAVGSASLGFCGTCVTGVFWDTVSFTGRSTLACTWLQGNVAYITSRGVTIHIFVPNCGGTITSGWTTVRKFGKKTTTP